MESMLGGTRHVVANLELVVKVNAGDSKSVDSQQKHFWSRLQI